MADSKETDSSFEKMMIEKMDEFIKWIKLIAKPRIRELVNQNLENEVEYSVYELSDGDLSSRDISDKLNNEISHTTVTNYWKKWHRLGIVEKSEKYQGRYKKICSLEEIGMVIPPLLSNNTSEEN
jgi:hypothetical protein